jgi:hypothetical protein
MLVECERDESLSPPMQVLGDPSQTCVFQRKSGERQRSEPLPPSVRSVDSC